MHPATSMIHCRLTYYKGSESTIWERAIKAALGRLKMADPPDLWVPRLEQEWGVRSLPVTFDHAIAVRSLPPHHNDPFDRMLVAQALCEQLTLITADCVLDGGAQDIEKFARD